MIQTPEALLNTHLVAVDGAVGIDPASLVVSGGFDNEGVALPMGSRIAVPTRLCVRSRQLAPVCPEVAPHAVSFEEHHEFVLELNESVVAVVEIAGVTGRVALEERIVPIFLILVEPKRQRRISGRRPCFTPLLFSPFRHGRTICLLYTSDAADERSSVDLGG